MPMRVMGYDYGAYKKQYESNSKKYTTARGLDEDEYLSRMKKTDRFVPVITVVVYYGEKSWDGARSLHDMLDIPEQAKRFVNDYKVLLVEAKKNELSFHNINNKDFFNLLEIILDKDRGLSETRDRAIAYTRDHIVDKSVLVTVAGTTNCKIDYDVFDRKGDADMCALWERIKEEGKEEGNIETALEVGLSEADILIRLQEKLNVSLQQAQKYFQMYGC